ncbi:MAG: ribonuclease P protein component 4 [Candidatus Nanohaloarchaea archaeon]
MAALAKQRIKKLFKQAEKQLEENPQLAQKHIKQALRIGESQNQPIPKKLKLKYCSNCHTPLKPGKNCKIRINSKKNTVNYRCTNCGEVKRHGY